MIESVLRANNKVKVRTSLRTATQKRQGSVPSESGPLGAEVHAHGKRNEQIADDAQAVRHASEDPRLRRAKQKEIAVAVAGGSYRSVLGKSGLPVDGRT